MSNIRTSRPLRHPLGISHFAELVRGGYTFIDKSLLIAEILATGPQTILIARPRRFGKTLNLSMLQHFLSAEVHGKPTRPLFDGLAISEQASAMEHQGRYPVIFVSFKDIKGTSFQACLEEFRTLLANLYQQHPQVLKSQDLDPFRRAQVEAILRLKADLPQMSDSIRLLSELLYKHHGQPAAILLDEYDTPLHAAYTQCFHPELIRFMVKLLGSALKDNPYLLKGVVTGITRIAKESLFSGLNNVAVYTVLDEGYDAYFGFTPAEVSALLQATGLTGLESQVKDWYDGYRFGRDVIYNPWSIVSCLENKGSLRPYWINSASDDILKERMAQADADFKEGLEWLIQDQSIREAVDPGLVFKELDGDAKTLWSLLLFSGYLTAEEVAWGSDGVARCRLQIPNREVAGLYRRHAAAWFSDTMGERGYEAFLKSLVSGEVTEFAARLSDFLLESMSIFDSAGRHPEKFYHGLTLGLMAGLRDSHVVHSNRESGYGRYDVALLPRRGAGKAQGGLGIIMEFKQASSVAKLRAAAKAALAQVRTRSYEVELRQHGVSGVLRMGLAFSGKRVAVAHSRGRVRDDGVQTKVRRSRQSK